MKSFGALLCGATVVGLAGVAAYKLLLTDEARAALSRSVREVRDSVHTINESLGEQQNNEKEALDNKRRTSEMWRALGY